MCARFQYLNMLRKLLNTIHIYIIKNESSKLNIKTQFLSHEYYVVLYFIINKVPILMILSISRTVFNYCNDFLKFTLTRINNL